MKLAIMQPYFLPYIGYFQLIAAVDTFIIYDNVKYTKKGWINRNRLLLNGRDAMFSLPLKKDSDYFDIDKRELANEFNPNKLLNQIIGAYRHAPQFKETLPLIEKIIQIPEKNHFKFLYNSILQTCNYLDISTKIVASSSIPIDHSLQAQDKVLAICKSLNAKTYINAIGGIDLYKKEEFINFGVELKFIQSTLLEYTQFNNVFVPWLSIIDIMMFNPLPVVQKMISSCYKYA